MTTGQILGDGAIAAQLLGLIDPPPGTAILCFSARGAAPTDPGAAHRAAMAGLGAAAELLASDARASLQALVLVVDDDGGSGTAAMLATFVSGFGKTLARELARSKITVNVVGGDFSADQSLAPLLGFLLSDGARFITGQSFGTAGARLADPRPQTRPVPAQGWLLVSGGAGAIGSAVTRRLHADGWKVVIGHRGRDDADSLARTLSVDGSTCRTVTLDIEDEAALQSLDPGLGMDLPLSGLVLCSGWNLTHPFWTSDATEWDRTLRINFTGPAQLAERLFGEASDAAGIVVAIGSEAGRAGDAGRAVYAGAKAAIARYTAVLARSASKVRAVTVAPGPVDTPLLRGTHGDDPAEVEQGLARLARLIPLGRMGLPEEIAAAVSFAASPVGTVLNGELVSVGGGITMQ